MVRTFFSDLTGANCRLGDQALVSLSASEDIDADYDTASAVTIAPGGPCAKGAVVQSIEGGLSTGHWVIEDPVVNRSGERTWRRRAGAGYAHVPLVAYHLRRKGYLEARATLSKATCGADHYPPRFCTTQRYAQICAEIDAAYHSDKTISSQEALKRRRAWIPVHGAEYIFAQVCRWVGLACQFDARLDCCADEYQPLDKPAMTALREIASWSGRSVFLDRSGVVHVFDWPEVFGRGGGHPWPAATLEEEIHDTLYRASHVTVVGHGYWHETVTIPAQPDREDPMHPGNIWPGHPAYTVSRYSKLVAVEVTEGLGGIEGSRPVVERIEINDYPISPTVAQRIARERLARIAIGGGISLWRGPAEGCQSVCPLATTATRVTRSLNWNGNAYRYEIEIAAPRTAITWGSGGWNETGWW